MFYRHVHIWSHGGRGTTSSIAFVNLLISSNFIIYNGKKLQKFATYCSFILRYSITITWWKPSTIFYSMGIHLFNLLMLIGGNIFSYLDSPNNSLSHHVTKNLYFHRWILFTQYQREWSNKIWAQQINFIWFVFTEKQTNVLNILQHVTKT